MSKKIEFLAHPDYVQLKEDYPEPIKINVPEWFKKLNHELGNFTIKGCIPFLETLTTGYLLKFPQDMFLNHNATNPETKIKDTFHRWGLKEESDYLRANGINLNSGPDLHTIDQLGGKEGGCPFVEQNKKLPFYKVLNPWYIKTPPGYSCLFVPPLNNPDDRFFPLAGIVQTDTFTHEINFPIVINGDKYPELKTVIKKGTPLVQVIPFKREDWKMEVKTWSSQERRGKFHLYLRNFFRTYRDRHWSKTSWK